MVVGIRVIVSEQMQDAVDAQQFDLVLGTVPTGLRLIGSDLRAQHDIAEQTGLRFRLMRADRRPRAANGRRRPELIHRERENVGRARFTHPSLMKVGHRALVDKQDRKLRQRMNAHPVQHVPGQGRDADLVDSDARLIGDIDAQ